MTSVSSKTIQLSSDHKVKDFDCGVPELNSWLQQSALNNQKLNTSRTFVLVAGDNVIAFYCLAAGNIARASLPNNKQRNSPRDVPLIALGRLAVDSRYQAKGIGAQLLRDAIARVIVATQQVAAKFLRVDAKDHAVARFYERFGFITDPNNPLALYLKLPNAPTAGEILQ